MSVFHRIAVVAGVATVLATLPAQASTITLTSVRSVSGGHSGVAVDSSTGVTYEVNGYNGQTGVRRYGSAAAFEAGSGSTVAGFSPGLWGTYFAADNGALFGRSLGSNGATISKVNGSTVTTVTVPGMGTLNGADTFDWGGYSGLNVMNDGNRLYVVGGDASSTQWRIASYDYNLNLLSNVLFTYAATGGCGSQSNPGFGFAIGGSIFLGNDYCQGGISTVVDASTGAVSNVSHTLAGFTGSSNYITNTSYDAYNDTLYAMDLASNKVYKLGNAAAAFGVQLNAVPEPSAIALAGLALALVGLQRRRLRG